MSSFFSDAELKGAVMLMALAGASGTGKSRSALRVATGMCGGDPSRVYVIDTEARRALHHAPYFSPPFKHADMRGPFRPQGFIDRIEGAIQAGAGAVVVDNFSDEWEGDGGLLDWAAAQGGRPDSWKNPKAAHKKLINYCRQSRVPIIFCLRADEKIAIVPDPDKPGKTMPISQGWRPICEKRFMYDMTVSFTLDPATRGCPRFDLLHKLPEAFAPFFHEGELIDERAGQAMAAWLDGAGAPPPPPMPETWPWVDGDRAQQQAPDLRTWANRCVAVIKAIEDPSRLAQWNGDMDAHLVLVEQHEPRASDHVRAAAEARMDALAAQEMPA